jgi:SAM-dependent methyltransferase
VHTHRGNDPFVQLRATTVPPLTPTRYAAAHAVWEAASDQRGRLRDWLLTELPPLVAHVRDRPVAVLGVGVGDGSVDGPLAAALAAGGRRVDYSGVEPHPPSAGAFAARLAGLGLPGLTVTVQVTDFASDAGTGPVDLVHFVHSLYYVRDVGAALDRALDRLGPDGVLVALTAPLHPLCVLTDALAPRDGHRQWFAEDVRAALPGRGVTVREATIEGRLDLGAVRTDPDGAGEQLLDFLVQGRTRALPAAARAVVLAHLEEIALPGPGWVVPHPLHVAVVTRAPDRERTGKVALTS